LHPHRERLAVFVVRIVRTTAEDVQQKPLGVVAIGQPVDVLVAVESVEPNVELVERREREVAT